MTSRTISIVTTLLLAVGPALEGSHQEAEAAAPAAIAGASGSKTAKKARKTRQARRAKRRKRAKKRKICRRVNGKRRCSWKAQFQGQNASRESLRTEPLPRPSGEIWLYAVNFREDLKVNIYDANGDFNDDALAQLDEIFRCKRTKQVRAVDPHLYEILSIIYDHYGQKRIDLISGFREKPDSETSRHFHGSAMDIRVPGVSTRTLYELAASLDLGGMGVGRYPASEFVHVDFRAPGEKSYRWTDYSPPKNKKRKPPKSRRKRPNV